MDADASLYPVCRTSHPFGNDKQVVGIGVKYSAPKLLRDLIVFFLVGWWASLQLPQSVRDQPLRQHRQQGIH